MKFYTIYAETCVEEFAQPGNELYQLVKGCFNSEFQFLDHSPLEASLSDEGGMIIPDFMIYESCVPIISERFRQLLDKAGVDNLFLKPVIFNEPSLGVRERCWLALPPRIECLNLRKSVIRREEIGEDEYELEAEKIVVNPRAIGNYKIFKLAPAYLNQDIIVTEDLAELIGQQDLANVNLGPLP